jgi:hypothetical protein
MYPKDIVGGGTGGFYSSDNIWIIGRQQEKEKDEIAGYHFIINVEKSRYVKEKSRIPVTVTFDKGVHRWSGLFDVATELGYIVKPKQGWYQLASAPEGTPNFRQADVIDNEDFWLKMIAQTDIAANIQRKYKLG